MKKRLFIAIPLLSALREKFSEYQAALKIPNIHWTPPENLHITVYFIGYVEERMVSKLTARIQEVCLRTHPFELTFENIVFAPLGAPARMIWAVFFDPNKEYKTFVDAVFEALKEFSARDYRGKDAIAHITLARFHDSSIAKNSILNQPELDDWVLKVTSCDLMESKFSRSGQVYYTIHHFLFAS